MTNNLKNYTIQLLNLKEIVLEDNPELKEDLREIIKQLKEEKQVNRYEHQFNLNELDAVQNLDSLYRLIKRQQEKFAILINNCKEYDPLFKTNVTILNLNIRRIKKIIKSKEANLYIYYRGSKKGKELRELKYSQC